MARFDWLSIWLAVVVFAAANAVVSLLYDLGTANPVEGRNAISFCNVLFVGNLCAVLTIGIVHRGVWRRETWRGLSRRDWIGLTIVAPLSSALAPALIFLALESTTVTNVVLVGRLEPPLLLAFAALLLGERPDRWTVLGALTTFIGVALMIGLQALETGVMIGRGELYATLGAAVLASSTVISKKRLNTVPIGAFILFRTGLGAVFFFATAAYLFGLDHFMDAFSPFLWQWMAIYGAVIVFGGQLLWFNGLRRCRAADVSLATSFTPVLGVLFAYALLNEQPGFPEWTGGAVILAGAAVAQVGHWRQRRRRRESDAAAAVAMEGAVGFKGI